MDKTENEDTYTTSVGRPIEAIVPSLDKPKLIDYSNQILPAKHYNHGDAIVYSSSRQAGRLQELRWRIYKKTGVFLWRQKSKRSKIRTILDCISVLNASNASIEWW